jgi:hypothetical protein
LPAHGPPMRTIFIGGIVGTCRTERARGSKEGRREKRERGKEREEGEREREEGERERKQRESQPDGGRAIESNW